MSCKLLPAESFRLDAWPKWRGSRFWTPIYTLIGNLADTQEVLDLCAEHGIAPEIELIDIKDVKEAYAKVENGETRFRCVIDMSSLS